MLPKIFRCLPSLEILSLEQHGNDKLPNDDYTWVEPKSVPKCLGFHLRVIKIEGFKGGRHELQFLKHCLGNAKVLHKLAISCQGLTQVEEDMRFYGELLKFSRASENYQIYRQPLYSVTMFGTIFKLQWLWLLVIVVSPQINIVRTRLLNLVSVL